MHRILSLVALSVLALTAVQIAPSATAFAKDATEAQYEVMNPWADADPKPLRGISPRLNNLDGKKIGLFANFKRSAVPQAKMVEKKLKEKYPTIQTSLYHSTEPNVSEIDTGNKEKFTAWVKDMDAIVAMVGD